MHEEVKIGALVTLGLVLATGGMSESGSRLVVLGGKVWQVTPQKRIIPFPFRFPLSFDQRLEGSSAPLPSPDGHWIAFSQIGGDYDLHLLDVRSGRERRITHFGQPPRTGYTFADALLNAWSWDSRGLLITVAAGETTSEEGDLLVPNVPYGSYIYHVSTGTTEAVPLPKGFQLAAWLPDGRLLGVIPGRESYEEDSLVMLRPGSTHAVAIATSEGSPHWVRTSMDGKWLTGIFTGSDGPQEIAKIVKLNLATMSAVTLVHLRSWTGNERPALSPEDGHVSYTEETPMVKGIPGQNLLVDRRILYSCSSAIDYQWLDEKSIALACQGTALVLDTATGRPMSE